MKQFYEVHEVEDVFTGEPSFVGTYTHYETAKADYDEIVKEGKFARLLKVTEDGEPIEELEANY